MKKEIEVLWKLNEDAESAVSKLHSAKFRKSKKIVDYYLYDPSRPDLQPSSEGRLRSCLRVRDAVEGSYLTYKKDHFEGDVWSYSDEIESAIENPDKIKSVFNALGFKLLVTVAVEKKYFDLFPYEIVIEVVDGLGTFVEVENVNQDDKRPTKEIKQEIRDFIEKLGLVIGEEENAGKPELLLRKQSEQG